ncbi:MAG TPA: antibiotic biosynthesis monooxygenase [Bacillota bacterium]|nr:antibiotic biosynthesis monooxygenase [Bacillota bacterium]
MIARSWHGAVPAEHGEAFCKHLSKTGIDGAKSIPGNLGVRIYRKRQGEFEHFFMISYWVNIEAIKAFAGPEPHIAVEYPGDEKYGLISDPIVIHFEVERVPEEFPLVFGE